MKKNILIFPGFVIDTWSSIEKRYIWLEEGLKNDFNIFWLVPPTGSVYTNCCEEKNRELEAYYVTKLKELGAKIIVLDISKKNLLKNFINISSILKKYKIDAVYTHFSALRYYVELTAKLNGIITIRGEHSDEFAEKRKYKLIKYFFWILFIDYFIVVSRAVSAFLTIKKIANNNLISLVYNGFDFASFPVSSKAKSKKKICDTYCLPKEAVILSCIAKIDANKNQNALVEMLNFIDNKNIYLFFVGSKTVDVMYTKQLDVLIKKYGLEKNVFLVGYQTDVYKYMDASSITYLPSFFEGLPNVVVESLYMKTPVIATDFSPLKEVVKHGYSGFLCPPDNFKKMAEYTNYFLSNPESVEKFGEYGHEYVKNKFSKDNFIKQHKAALSKALMRKDFC